MKLGIRMCDGIGGPQPVEKTEAEKRADRLDEIGRLIAAGAKPSSFEKELNKLLDTEMEPRDFDEEARWEEDYRNGGTD
jgi:hypothetical protein